MRNVFNKAKFRIIAGLGASESIKIGSRRKLTQLNHLKRNFEARTVARLNAFLISGSKGKANPQ